MFGFLRASPPTPRSELVAALDRAALPQVPAVATRALAALRNPAVPTQALCDVVGADPALTARLIRTANSPAFGLRTPVDNLRHALVMLGRAQVELIVLAVATQKALPARPTGGFEPRRFWSAAARRAGVAAALAARVDRASMDLSFTAGLLSDLAVPLLAHARGPAYDRLLLAWHHREAALEVLERQEFGWDHAQVGGWLAEAWAFPDRLRAALDGHHGGADAPEPVRLVALLPEGEGEEGVERLVEAARSRCGLQPEATRAAVAEGEARGQELARHFAA